MKYYVPVEGMETRKVFVNYATFWGARLMIDDEPAPKGKKRGEYLIERDNGEVSVAKFKGRFLDPFLNIVVDGKEIELVEPLSWRQWFWAWLPLLLMFISFLFIYGASIIGMDDGLEKRIPSNNTYILNILVNGFLTGLLMLTVNINFHVFRSNKSSRTQYGLVALLSFGVVVIFYASVISVWITDTVASG